MSQNLCPERIGKNLDGYALVTGVAWANVEPAQPTPLNHKDVGQVSAPERAYLTAELAVGRV
jgi:hypothetical protein